jgi:hypothetical protein
MSNRERFRGLLKDLFVDNTEDEAFALWRYTAAHVPDRAREDLAILDAVLDDPPADLVALMEQDGWIHLVHRPDDHTATPYSFDEYLAWLRRVTERFRAACTARPQT